MDSRRLVENLFSEPRKCSGHCEQSATLRFLNSTEPLLACYACPAGYVSKLMAYGGQASREELVASLGRALGGRAIKADEIRIATRHSWDLGMAGSELRVAYWNQNYRSSKSDDPDRNALFICSNCGSTFVQQISAPGTICKSCESQSAGGTNSRQAA